MLRTVSQPLRCLLVISAALSTPLIAASAEPSARLKHKLVRGVERCLLNRAFVMGVDFERWPDILAKHMSTVEESTTNYALASGFNRALAEFDVSHLQVATPALMAARRDGRTVGAGLKVVPIAAGQLVTSVAGDSPAAAAGLERGDLIVSVDGTPVAGGEPYLELIDYRLSGAPGTTRRVAWLRDGEAFEAAIGFAEFAAAPPIALDWIGDIAWLRVPSFLWQVYDRPTIENAFSEISTRANGLVIDIRSNSGGRFSNVMHLASFLVPQGTTGGIITERKDYLRRRQALARRDMPAEQRLQQLGDAIPITMEIGSRPFAGPLVVLIDGAAGSGGDLFPAIMQDQRDATLVGATTAGALLGGQWCDLAGGFELVFPSQEILRPSGGRIEGVGVAPDIELSPVETVDDEHIRNVALELFAVAQ